MLSYGTNSTHLVIRLQIRPSELTEQSVAPRLLEQLTLDETHKNEVATNRAFQVSISMPKASLSRVHKNIV